MTIRMDEPGAATLGAASAVLPRSSTVTPTGHLFIGGCDTLDLAARFGTPIYLYDEAEIRTACRSYLAALVTPWPANSVHYAAKAYLSPWLCRVLVAEGLALDVVSGGELYVALAAGVPPRRIRLHGNNKSSVELEEGCRAGIGAVVIDNLAEIDLLAGICRRLGRRQPVLLRLAPGITAHTHTYLQTGAPDSKFGLALACGMAAEAVERCLAARDWLDLRGYHTHIGTQILEVEPFALAAAALARFAAEMDALHGYWPAEVSPGGGLAAPYTPDEVVPSPAMLAAAIMAPLQAVATARGRPLPAVSVEPGRSIVSRAGVALYTVGGVKDIAGIRRYVLIDGGMADNIRPPLYGARYTILAAGRAGTAMEGSHPVTVAGRYCESGDVLATDIALPALHGGDLLAVACAGAYCLPMSSSYNMALRPAVVVVHRGRARLVERRATYADLLALDVSQPETPPAETSL
jgi:diaminopimelate decarboxylase